MQTQNTRELSVRVLHTVPVKNLRLLTFDLDGTLIDSRDDLAQSINAMLAHYGRPSLPADVIASYIGDGAPMLVRRALGDPDDEKLVHEALEFFLAYYKIHKLDFTYVYAGVIEALQHLRDAWAHGPPPHMAILTNKPVGASRAICDALRLTPFFFQIYGGNSFEQKKPDPIGIEKLLEESGISRQRAIMVGDSGVDVRTARNAKIKACGVSYGFQPESFEQDPPDILVDDMNQLAEFLVTGF